MPLVRSCPLAAAFLSGRLLVFCTSRSAHPDTFLQPKKGASFTYSELQARFQNAKNEIGVVCDELDTEATVASLGALCSPETPVLIAEILRIPDLADSDVELESGLVADMRARVY